MMKLRPYAAGAAMLMLTGCAAGPVAGALGGVGVTGAAIAAVTGVSTATLSEVAMAGCAAQAAANLAGAIAKQKGSAAWAADFAKASEIAGFACAW